MTKKLSVFALILGGMVAFTGLFIIFRPNIRVTVVESVVDDVDVIPATPEPTLSPEDDPRFSDLDSNLLLANKKHPLPDGYIPDDLREMDIYTAGALCEMREEAAKHMEDMFAAALKDGVQLVCASAYRSEERQLSLYSGYVKEGGQDFADSVSSRPGYSEHQTGLAADLSYQVNEGFADTPQGQWLAAHAHEYGFILRYPKGKEDITGFDFEPWHFRYVGMEYAKDIYRSGQCFEEYFGLEGGDYK